ncbi:MAG: hypothetical protein ACFFCW_12180 [Candidatus Hodarchaeota archaeon]
MLLQNLYPTLPNDSLQLRRHRRLTGHGAVVAGEVTLTLAQLCQQYQPRFDERHDALFSVIIIPLSGTRLR